MVYFFFNVYIYLLIFFLVFKIGVILLVFGFVYLEFEGFSKSGVLGLKFSCIVYGLWFFLRLSLFLFYIVLLVYVKYVLFVIK